MSSEGVLDSRCRGCRVGAAVLAALLTVAVFDGAAAQDDRYPVISSPRGAPPSNIQDKQRRPAVLPQGTPPAKGAPVTTATAPLPASGIPLAPHNPKLDGVPLDPAWPKQVFVIGDSVMVGARAALLKGLPGWQVTLTAQTSLTIPRALADLPRVVPPVVVVGLGYNSSWQRNRQNHQFWVDGFDKSADAMIAALKARGAKKIVWVLLRELDLSYATQAQMNREGWYFPYVNERLYALKERHPDIALADWVSAARVSGITYDAIHPNARGAELMTEVVRAAIGLEPPPQTAAPATAVAATKPPEATPPAPEKPQAAAEPASPPELRKSDPDVVAAVTPLEKPTYAFRDCARCPEMVIIPAGSFQMGSPEDEADRSPSEGPQRLVTITRPIAVGKFEVTFAEWEACVAGGGCTSNPAPGDEGWGKEQRPVINVSWDDAQEYVAWLSKQTGKPYRLLSEAEWEYAARAGTTSPFPTGATVTPDQANFQTAFKDDGENREGEYREQTVKVGSFPPNAFDLHDMHGNVWEWVQDNWHEDYAGAPADGAVRPGGDKTQRAKRGGGWYSLVVDLRSASRQGDQPDHRGGDIGFRVARGL